MNKDDSRPQQKPGEAAGQTKSSGSPSHRSCVSAQLHYVVAERDKRVRALWQETVAGDEARKYLTEVCQLTEATIKHYHVGLVSYRREGVERSMINAICVPVADERGAEYAPCLAAETPGAKRRGQYVLLAVPGVTLNAKDVQWKRGQPLTMYTTNDGGADLAVCTRILDAMLLAQVMEKRCPGRFTIICSSHIHEYPIPWYSPDFWARWQRVYVTPGNTRHARELPLKSTADVWCSQIASMAVRPLLRVQIPENGTRARCSEWSGFLRSGGTPDGVLEQFEKAQIFKMEVSITENLSVIEPPRLEEFSEGEYGDITHDVSYNYVRGFYYYPFSVLRFSLEANDQKRITRTIRLLRNDGRILGWSRVPSSHGGSDVIAADDGTLLSRPPEVSESATWSLENILTYAREIRSGQLKGRKLADILLDMLKLLEECIWLPRREQFYLLLFAIPATYVQELFDAVPYLLIQGPKGSGKSELAHVLSWLCSNSTIIGSGSHAFTAAQIDQARGLIVLDDRETLAAEDLDADLLELLKIGYKRATGARGIVAQNRKIIRQHVYGVKAITCIAGVEEIVGTRMLRIRTAPFRATAANIALRRFQASDQESADRLRQELHSWAFRNIALVKAEYEKLSQADSRWTEITAPLRTFAALAGDARLQSSLHAAIDNQERLVAADMTPEDVLDAAMEELVRRGFKNEVSITHIANEFACRFQDVNSASVVEIAPRSSWITRTLKGRGWIKATATVRRARVRKKVLQRIWELDPDKVAAVLQSPGITPADAKPLSFCQKCGECEYRSVCSIKSHFPRDH